ncbi:MAG: TylF/MycF/NovP-related O-methyltransferase, partial [Bacteroidota bacterium]
SHLSKWVHANRSKLAYDDFPNPAPVHKDRLKLYDFIAEKEQLRAGPISYLEFGVGRGNSLRWWSSQNRHENTAFWAFDTYTGLPEKYGNYAEGTFQLDGQFPDIQDERINFVKGLFQDTLLDHLEKIDFKQRVYLHLDGDLYTSTMYPLAVLYPYLKPGDIVVFDEFGVPLHEFRAFQDFTRSFRMQLEPIGAINNYLQLAFRVAG